LFFGRLYRGWFEDLVFWSFATRQASSFFTRMNSIEYELSIMAGERHASMLRPLGTYRCLQPLLLAFGRAKMSQEVDLLVLDLCEYFLQQSYVNEFRRNCSLRLRIFLSGRRPPVASILVSSVSGGFCAPCLPSVSQRSATVDTGPLLFAPKPSSDCRPPIAPFWYRRSLEDSASPGFRRHRRDQPPSTLDRLHRTARPKPGTLGRLQAYRLLDGLPGPGPGTGTGRRLDLDFDLELDLELDLDWLCFLLYWRSTSYWGYLRPYCITKLTLAGTEKAPRYSTWSHESSWGLSITFRTSHERDMALPGMRITSKVRQIFE
jgi:hypothetical protein